MGRGVVLYLSSCILTSHSCSSHSPLTVYFTGSGFFVFVYRPRCEGTKPFSRDFSYAFSDLAVHDLIGCGLTCRGPLDEDADPK